MLLALLPLLGLQAAATPPQIDLNQAITYIESHAQLPPEAKPLKDYVRVYALDSSGLRIDGEYSIGFLKMPPGVYVVPYNQLPSVADGTCATNLSVFYTPEEPDVLVTCKGHTPPPPGDLKN